MKKDSHSLLYIKIFLSCVLIAGFLSVSYKIFILVKDSSFKYDSFNLLVVGKKAQLVHFDSDKKKMAIIDLISPEQTFNNKHKISSSLVVGIPIDGKIIYSLKDNDFLSIKNVLPIILTPQKYKLEGINQFDILKLSAFSYLVSKSDKSFEKIDLGGQEKVAGSKFLSVFRDPEILNEKLSIEIINSTDIDGLGGKITTILENASYNIISISTGTHQESRIITQRKESVTVKRLQSFFGIEVVKARDQGIADVSVILGRDLVKNLN